MAKQVMHRKASDNQYLHRDFHGALSAGIEYLHRTYGADAVRDYLWQFGRAYYAPLTAALRRRGLVALEEHYRKVYDAEGGTIELRRTEDELRIEVKICPAVTHMRAHRYEVATLFHETTATVNRALCHDTEFAAELLDYDDLTGAHTVRFYRRPQ